MSCVHQLWAFKLFRPTVRQATTLISGKRCLPSRPVVCLRTAGHKMRCNFYPRDAMLARVIAIATCLSVCLSIRLSRAGIVSKRRKLAAWFLHHLVAPRLQFSDAKFHHQILNSPRTGASNKGRSRKFSDFLALSVNIPKTVADTAKVTISD